MKVLKSVKLLIVHCVANRCDKPFSVEKLIACGKAKYGHCELPGVHKLCPCYTASKEYADLQPQAR